jgi:hypothetical protein
MEPTEIALLRTWSSWEKLLPLQLFSSAKIRKDGILLTEDAELIKILHDTYRVEMVVVPKTMEKYIVITPACPSPCECDCYDENNDKVFTYKKDILEQVLENHPQDIKDFIKLSKNMPMEGFTYADWIYQRQIDEDY